MALHRVDSVCVTRTGGAAVDVAVGALGLVGYHGYYLGQDVDNESQYSIIRLSVDWGAGEHTEQKWCFIKCEIFTTDNFTAIHVRNKCMARTIPTFLITKQELIDSICTYSEE